MHVVSSFKTQFIDENPFLNSNIQFRIIMGLKFAIEWIILMRCVQLKAHLVIAAFLRFLTYYMFFRWRQMLLHKDVMQENGQCLDLIVCSDIIVWTLFNASLCICRHLVIRCELVPYKSTSCKGGCNVYNWWKALSTYTLFLRSRNWAHTQVYVNCLQVFGRPSWYCLMELVSKRVINTLLSSHMSFDAINVQRRGQLLCCLSSTCGCEKPNYVLEKRN